MFTALTKMEPDWWLELESTYPKRIRQRQELFAKHDKCVLDALPGSELACKELMEMCLQFLCARYPHYFRLDKENMIFYNSILNTQSKLRDTPPLEVLLNNVPEDFGIMLRDPETGFYHFRAGMICSALGWNVSTKLGMRLHEIHEPIPDYKEKMQFSMDRFVILLLFFYGDLLKVMQIFRQETMREAYPKRFMGSRGRPTTLHAARRPPRKVPRTTSRRRNSRSLQPPR
jgi:hypothetical protein